MLEVLRRELLNIFVQQPQSILKHLFRPLAPRSLRQELLLLYLLVVVRGLDIRMVSELLVLGQLPLLPLLLNDFLVVEQPVDGLHLDILVGPGLLLDGWASAATFIPDDLVSEFEVPRCHVG